MKRQDMAAQEAGLMSCVLGAIRARVHVREPRHLPVSFRCFADPRYDFELEGVPMTATQLADVTERQLALLEAGSVRHGE